MTVLRSPLVCSFVLCLALGGRAAGRPVLIGSTGSLANQPQTTARIVDLDRTTGVASNPRDTGLYAMAGIAVQPGTGTLFGLTTDPTVSLPNTLVRIDPVSGTPTPVGPTGLFVIEGDLAFNPSDGQLYGIQTFGSGSASYLFRIDVLTGTGTVVGNTGVSNADLSSIAFAPNGDLFVINSAGTSNSVLIRIDPITGAAISTAQLNVNLGSGVGMAFDPFSGQGYVADGGTGTNNSLFLIDTNSAQCTLIGPVGFTGGISGLTFASVPEPSGLALLALSASFFIRRFRRL